MSHPNTVRLHAIMRDENLSRHDVAELLDCAPHTVSCWRSGSPRPIPDRELDRLQLKLQIIELKDQIARMEASPAHEAREASHA